MKYIKKWNFSNEITIKYKVGKEDDIKIFDDIFVENNEENCNIIYDNKIIELKLFFNIGKKNLRMTY